jgi:hypothetical protein
MELIRCVDDKYVPQFTALHRSVIDYSLATIKAALLLNGGGAVALLSFMAAKAVPNPASLACTLGLFIIGAILAALTAGVSYLAQSSFVTEVGWMWAMERDPGDNNHKKNACRARCAGRCLQVLGCGLFVAALAAFCWGCLSAYAVLSGVS